MLTVVGERKYGEERSVLLNFSIRIHENKTSLRTRNTVGWHHANLIPFRRVAGVAPIVLGTILRISRRRRRRQPIHQRCHNHHHCGIRTHDFRLPRRRRRLRRSLVRRPGQIGQFDRRQKGGPRIRNSITSSSPSNPPNPINVVILLIAGASAPMTFTSLPRRRRRLIRSLVRRPELIGQLDRRWAGQPTNETQSPPLRCQVLRILQFRLLSSLPFVPLLVVVLRLVDPSTSAVPINNNLVLPVQSSVRIDVYN